MCKHDEIFDDAKRTPEKRCWEQLDPSHEPPKHCPSPYARRDRLETPMTTVSPKKAAKCASGIRTIST